VTSSFAFGLAVSGLAFAPVSARSLVKPDGISSAIHKAALQLSDRFRDLLRPELEKQDPKPVIQIDG